MIDSMKCFDGSQKVLEIPGIKTIEQFITEVEENEEEFIFKHLQQYCEGVSSVTGITHVPKQLLIRALTCFRQEHKEEYDFLMGRENSNGTTHNNS